MFGLGKQQYLLLSDERFTSVDLSDRLGVVADEGGNEFARSDQECLARRDAGVVPAARSRRGLGPGAQHWRTVASADVESTCGPGRDDRHARGRRATGPVGPRRPRVVVPVAGPGGTAAELDWMARERAHRRRASPTHFANPEFLAAGTPEAPDLSAFGMGRNKMCCVPMAWFSHDFVLFATSDPDGAYRVLAWRVGTPDVYRVSDYTDLPPRNFSASWAEDAFR